MATGAFIASLIILAISTSSPPLNIISLSLVLNSSISTNNFICLFTTDVNTFDMMSPNDISIGILIIGKSYSLAVSITDCGRLSMYLFILIPRPATPICFMIGINSFNLTTSSLIE